ncbi:putative membrane protein [Taylorella asinigenitalis 14/45]|uniref:Putative membrane protein n=1 Tax=Taylorella asinigenitalis 14/45 TaxID=1091495 RepID=I7IL72_9BURK|nr:phage holin family protein [Taylorella asinigenitalis]CCG19839.1 putative membrane protein [Taylorella asinigenitalis 14/45]
MHLRQTIAQLINSFITYTETRGKIFGVELTQARAQVTQALVWGVASLIFALLGLTLLSFAIILLTWETEYRNWVVCLLPILYFVIAYVAINRVSALIKAPTFEYTIKTLKEDVEYFKDHPEFPTSMDILTSDGGKING